MTEKWDDPEVWNRPETRHIYSPEASDDAPKRRWWRKVMIAVLLGALYVIYRTGNR